MESLKELIEERLKRQGYKLTKQREAILEVLEDLKEHATTTAYL